MIPAKSLVFLFEICVTMGYGHTRWTGSESVDSCPALCRCVDVPTNPGTGKNAYSRNTQYIGQSKIRVNSIQEVEPVGGWGDAVREMVCLGLPRMPAPLPADLGKLTIYGDSSGLRRNQMDNSISPDADASIFSAMTQLTELNSESFKPCRQLTAVTMSGNNIKILFPNIFSSLGKLRILKLQANNIEHLSSSAFNGIRHLEQLHLSDNMVASLPSRVFTPLSNLKTLNLNGNKIRFLYKNLFRSLTALEHLDMSRNNFTDLYDNIFDGNTALRELNLNGNRLWVVRGRWFKNLISLETLSIEGNSIKRLSAATFSNLYNLRFLYLSANHISIVHQTAFQNLTRLEILDLATNDLTYFAPDTFQSLQSLSELLLGSNSLKVTKKGTFDSLQNLLKLDISRNKIREIEPYSFDSLTTIKTLDLSHNKIKAIKRGSFTGLVQLIELKLDHNFISKLEEYSLATAAMSHLSTLTWLNLQYNRIKKIGAHVFAGLPYLKFINLGHNKLVNLDKKSFMSMASLRTVSLNNNRLRQLENGLFVNQGEVRDLNIAHNRMKSVSPGLLVGLDHLEDLNLQSNSLTHVPNELFRAVTNLIQINLKRNKLQTFDFVSVSSLTHLIHLDLSENNLTYVNVFDSLRMRLNHLLLASNKLQMIEGGIAQAVRSYGVISMNDNPWFCDCELAWILDSLASSKIRLEKSSESKCSGPPRLAGRKIEDLDEDDFLCDESNEISTSDFLFCDNPALRMGSTNKTRNKKDAILSRHVTFTGKTRKPLLNGILLNSDWAVTSGQFLAGTFRGLGLADVQAWTGNKDRSRIMAYIHHSFTQNPSNDVVLLRLHSKYPMGKMDQTLPCFVSKPQFRVYSQSNKHVVLTGRLDGSKPRSRLRSRHGELSEKCPDNGLICAKVRDSGVTAKRTSIFHEGAPLFSHGVGQWHLMGMGMAKTGRGVNGTMLSYLPLWDAARWISYVMKEVDKQCMVEWMNGKLKLECKDLQMLKGLGLKQNF